MLVFAFDSKGLMKLLSPYIFVQVKRDPKIKLFDSLD